jgi:hypothetical protein
MAATTWLVFGVLCLLGALAHVITAATDAETLSELHYLLTDERSLRQTLQGEVERLQNQLIRLNSTIGE